MHRELAQRLFQGLILEELLWVARGVKDQAELTQPVDARPRLRGPRRARIQARQRVAGVDRLHDVSDPECLEHVVGSRALDIDPAAQQLGRVHAAV